MSNHKENLCQLFDMSYKEDSGLEWLKNVPNEELKPLMDFINVDPKDSKPRLHSQTERFMKAGIPMYKCISSEMRAYGSNTILSIFGVQKSYREILETVCKDKKIAIVDNSKSNNKRSLRSMELEVLKRFAKDSISNMSEAQAKNMYENLPKEFQPVDGIFNKEALYLLVNSIFQSGGFASYTVLSSLISGIGSVFGITFSFGVYTAMSTLASVLLGPIGVAWACFNIAGPANRIVVPAIFYIAMIRMRYEEQNNLVVTK
ncbi:hypothetical protein [Aeromonas veronii]|uniref:hypothetical protein n=1 Tax=Aeromonas veronii TaxID=654 RepID=UPI003F7956FB